MKIIIQPTKTTRGLEWYAQTQGDVVMSRYGSSRNAALNSLEVAYLEFKARMEEEKSLQDQLETIEVDW